MREPILKRATRGVRSSLTASSPAPIGGWNARDPEAAMKPSDAVWLENWWPGTADVTVRKGAANHATGIGGQVESLMAYSSPTAQKMFAATPTALYDVSSTGAVGAPIKSLSSGRFRHAHFTVAGASYLLAVNGVDKLQAYNGTAWQDIDSTTTPAITGIATTEFDNINIFKRRVWFVQKNSMSAWYLPVNLIAGAATEFPLGQLFRFGGRLVAMASWTIDGGSGVDDYAVFITSEGEVAVYKGTDPTSGSGDFQLVGVYFIGEPVGKKCFIKFGGDLLLITQVGLFPLSKAFLSSTLNRASAVSDKIESIFSQSASAYGANYGWSGEVFASENLLLVNVPTSEGVSSNQFVMNTLTNAWALFTGWNAFCWEVWQEGLYFGGDGVVAKAFTGNSDFNTNITARAKTAFNYFGSSAVKHFKLLRPIIRTNGDVSVDLGIDVDFEDSDTGGAISITSPLSVYWDAALWDQVLWGADYSVKKDWRTVFGKEGFCAALRLRVAVKDVRVGWSSTDFVYQKGGIL